MYEGDQTLLNELKLLLAVLLLANLLATLRRVTRDPTAADRPLTALWLPKGTNLYGFTQDDLDALAFKLNSQLRKNHALRSPLAVYADLLINAQLNEYK